MTEDSAATGAGDLEKIVTRLLAHGYEPSFGPQWQYMTLPPAVVEQAAHLLRAKDAEIERLRKIIMQRQASDDCSGSYRGKP